MKAEDVHAWSHHRDQQQTIQTIIFPLLDLSLAERLLSCLKASCRSFTNWLRKASGSLGWKEASGQKTGLSIASVHLSEPMIASGTLNFTFSISLMLVIKHSSIPLLPLHIRSCTNVCEGSKLGPPSRKQGGMLQVQCYLTYCQRSQRGTVKPHSQLMSRTHW